MHRDFVPRCAMIVRPDCGETMAGLWRDPCNSADPAMQSRRSSFATLPADPTPTPKIACARAGGWTSPNAM